MPAITTDSLDGRDFPRPPPPPPAPSDFLPPLALRYPSERGIADYSNRSNALSAPYAVEQVPGLYDEVRRSPAIPLASPVTSPPTSQAHHRRGSSPNDSFSSAQWYRDPKRLPDPRNLRVRTSDITYASNTTYSSVYPPSSSSLTGPESTAGPESPSAPSTPSIDHFIADPVEPNRIDADDVSYRLRLLVRNNYFLPPAHSKPSPSELQLLSADGAPHHAFSPPKAPNNPIRDFFRAAAGKKPAPLRAPDAPQSQPELRTRTTRSQSGTLRAPLEMTPPRGLSVEEIPERKGKVVVIRERVDDLFKAAQEAEQDMRARTAEKSKLNAETKPSQSKSRPGSRNANVDPTDTVDLPSYGFPQQASTLQGLSIGASVSAAALADQLPPVSSIQLSETAEENAWRKALLHQAVGMSMLSIPPPMSPMTSAFSKASDEIITSTPSHSRPQLGQPILSDILSITSPPVSYPKRKGHSRPGTGGRRPQLGSDSRPHSSTKVGRHSNALERSETPAVQPRPLPPPPRRPPLRNVFSSSHPAFPEPTVFAPVSHPTIRRSLSTPLLSDEYITELPPPPLPPLASTLVDEPRRLPGRDSSNSLVSSTSGSNYSEEDDEALPQGRVVMRPSFASSYDSSTSNSNRPSLSASHRTHASAIFGRDSAHQQQHGTMRAKVANPAQPEYPPLPSIVPFPPSGAPAPRQARHPHLASLAPPPRPSTAPGPQSAPPPTLTFFNHLQVETAERRHSTGGESDLESLYTDARVRAISSTSSAKTARPILRASPNADASGTYLVSSPTTTTMAALPYDALDPTKPLTNTPSQPAQCESFLSRITRASSTRSVPGSKGVAGSSVRIPASAFELMRLQTECPQGGSAGAIASADSAPISIIGDNTQGQSVALWTDEQAMVNPSIRKLDGMLAQHIEAEKDTMRRIALGQKN